MNKNDTKPEVKMMYIFESILIHVNMYLLCKFMGVLVLAPFIKLSNYLASLVGYIDKTR
jgi:hypothetical protein